MLHLCPSVLINYAKDRHNPSAQYCRLPEGTLGSLRLRFTPYVKLRRQGSVKPRLRASVTLEKRRGGFYQKYKSPISPSRKIRSGSIGCLGCSPAVNPRNLRKACGFPSAFSDSPPARPVQPLSPPARRALRITNKIPAIFHTPNTKYNPRHVPVIQNNACLTRYIYILILPIYLSSFATKLSRAIRSVRQIDGLLIRRSGVQIPHGPLHTRIFEIATQKRRLSHLSWACFLKLTPPATRWVSKKRRRNALFIEQTATRTISSKTKVSRNKESD